MDKIIQGIIEKAKKDKMVLAVALFGSYARGEPHRDIDICIFLKPREYSQLKMTEKRMEYIPENEKYDLQIFQQLPLYIRKRILEDGKVLYCRDERVLYDIYFNTLNDFELFKPKYEEYIEAVLNE